MSAALGTIAGIVLAGGSSRRMGTDKRAVRLGDCSLLQRAVSRARPQVSALVVAVGNGPPPPDLDAGLQYVADSIDDGGPLAGVAAGLAWAVAQRCSRAATFAADCPFAPRDLVARLCAVATLSDPAAITVATGGGRRQHAFALWPVSLAGALHEALESGQRRIEAFQGAFEIVTVEFPVDPVDPFFNINTPEDLSVAATFLAE